MSFWVNLVNNEGDLCEVAEHEDGGTFCVGGSGEASLNVTYNYSSHYFRYLDSYSGLRWLDGKTAKDCIDRLRSAVERLGIQRDSDYWKATPGNAGYALSILLSWAEQYSEGVFQVH